MRVIRSTSAIALVFRLHRQVPAIFALAALVGIAAPGDAAAQSALRRGEAAMARQDYPAAAKLLSPLAQVGNPDAQASLGYLYAIGRGVPQNDTQAGLWYRRAADQGQPFAQYQLGLLYDKGQGVPQDVVEAEKWLILATAAGAPPRVVEERKRMRDAVRTKMTRGEIAEARMRALAWLPRKE